MEFQNFDAGLLIALDALLSRKVLLVPVNGSTRATSNGYALPSALSILDLLLCFADILNCLRYPQ